MSFLLLTATPALSMADEGGFKNELGVTLSLKDYGIMTDLNLFNFHIKAGISAPAVRDAVVKAAELTGEAAKAVYDTSKHVIVFTGERALQMAELATDYGIRASKYAYNKGKKMIVIFGDTAQYIGKKLVKATKQVAKLTHGIIVATGEYAERALEISIEAMKEFGELLYNSGKEVVNMAVIGTKHTARFLKETTIATGTFIANTVKGTYTFLKYAGQDLLSLLERTARGAVKLTKAAYKETKKVSLVIIKAVYKGGKIVVKSIKWAGKKTLKGLKKTFKFLFGWIPKISVGLNIGKHSAKLEIFTDSILDLQLR